MKQFTGELSVVEVCTDDLGERWLICLRGWVQTLYILLDYSVFSFAFLMSFWYLSLAEVAEEAGVVSIPTIQFYYDGKLLDTIVGCVAKGVLANAVDKVLEDIQQAQQQIP